MIMRFSGELRVGTLFPEQYYKNSMNVSFMMQTEGKAEVSKIKDHRSPSSPLLLVRLLGVIGDLRPD